MLHASLSTIVMAVITTNIFLILLTLCLSYRKLLLDVGYKLLVLFVFFTVLRLALPFELPFTVTIRLPKFIPPIVSLCRIQLGYIGGLPISLWTLFLAVWAIGTTFSLIRYIFSYCKTRYQIILYGKELTHKAPYSELLDDICRERNQKNRFRVIELPGLAGPALFGPLSPRILVPENFDLSEQNLYYVLRHETAHHFHHDLLLKILVKIITLVYWWDLFCRKLNEQTAAILEMRVDDSLTLTDPELTTEYMNCLVAAKSFAAQRISLSNDFIMQLLPEKTSDDLKRFSLLQNNQRMPRPILNTLLGLVTLSIFLFSYVFIGEPFVSPEDSPLPPAEEQELETFLVPSAENSYFIDRGDGSYDLYYYGEYYITTDSLEYHLSDIPVYTEENRPQ